MLTLEYIRDNVDMNACSMSENGTCYYRHPDNKDVRCFVGQFIPDELEDQIKEGLPANFLFEHSPEILEALQIEGLTGAEPFSFWNALQIVHDTTCLIGGQILKDVREEKLNIVIEDYRRDRDRRKIHK